MVPFLNFYWEPTTDSPCVRGVHRLGQSNEKNRMSLEANLPNTMIGV